MGSVPSLHDAARTGDVEGCRKALQKKGGVNSTIKDQFTALHLAAMGGHKDVCELLLQNGADVNAPGHDERTALHWAALSMFNKGSAHDICALLLKARANCNAKAKFNFTPLHFAAKMGNRDVCSVLIDAGADMSATDSKAGETPLHLAAASGSSDVCAVFFNSRPPMMGDFFSALPQSSPTVDAQDFHGDTPLHIAARIGSIEICEMLVKSGGANVSLRNLRGNAPYDEAVQNMHLDVRAAMLGRQGVNHQAVCDLLKNSTNTSSA